MGVVLSQAGAYVNVCRSLKSATELLGRGAFDAVVLDGDFPRDILLALRASIEAAEVPVLSVGIASAHDPASVQRLVEAGVFELVMPPMSVAAVVDAVERCVLATARVRKASAQSAPGQAAQSGPYTDAHRTTAIPRFNPAVEFAVEQHARDAALSPREVSVLKYITLGLRYIDIGEALGISARTVKMHSANIRRKLKVSDRVALIQKILGRRFSLGSDNREPTPATAA